MFLFQGFIRISYCLHLKISINPVFHTIKLINPPPSLLEATTLVSNLDQVGTLQPLPSSHLGNTIYNSPGNTLCPSPALDHLFSPSLVLLYKAMFAAITNVPQKLLV